MSSTVTNFERFAAPEKPPPAKASEEDSFKQLRSVQIKRLCKELTPSALKVWLYHHSRSGPEDTSYPSVQTIARETDQNEDTVRDARKLLKLGGWLIEVGKKRLGNRGYVPILQTTFPTERLTGSFSRSVNTPLPRKKPAGENSPTEVDSKHKVKTLTRVADATLADRIPIDAFRAFKAMRGAGGDWKFDPNGINGQGGGNCASPAGMKQPSCSTMGPQWPHAASDTNPYPTHFYRIQFKRIDGDGIKTHWREWYPWMANLAVQNKNKSGAAQSGN